MSSRTNVKRDNESRWGSWFRCKYSWNGSWSCWVMTAITFNSISCIFIRRFIVVNVVKCSFRCSCWAAVKFPISLTFKWPPCWWLGFLKQLFNLTVKGQMRRQQKFLTRVTTTMLEYTLPSIIQKCYPIKRNEESYFRARGDVKSTQHQFNGTRTVSQWLIDQEYPVIATIEHFHLWCLLCKSRQKWTLYKSFMDTVSTEVQGSSRSFELQRAIQRPIISCHCQQCSKLIQSEQFPTNSNMTGPNAQSTSTIVIILSKLFLIDDSFVAITSLPVTASISFTFE